MNAAGSPLYRARFQWQPTLTSHDPDNILTLENAPVVYTATGDVALTFAVASPQTATYAEPVAIALLFAVAAPQTATYAEPVAVALTFGVGSPFEFTSAGGTVYEVTGDVALTFGVDSAFQFISAATTVLGGGGGHTGKWKRPRPLAILTRPIARAEPPQPVTHSFDGAVAFAPGWKPQSPWSTSSTGVVIARISPRSPFTVTRAEQATMQMCSFHGHSAMAFTVSPQLDEWLIIDPDNWLEAILSEEELATTNR